MPYLYHSFVSAKGDSPDTTLVRPTNWNSRLQYGSFAATGPSGTDAFVKDVLLANRTYYVRTDGNNGNTGLADTAGSAWLTIPYGVSWLFGNLDFNGFTVTIQVATGTYTDALSIFSSWTGGGILYLKGDTTTPTNVLWNVTGDILQFKAPGYMQIGGFELRSTGVCLTANAPGAHLGIGAMRYGASTNYHLNVDSGGFIETNASYTISGNAIAHMLASNGGQITASNLTVTLVGNPAFSFTYVRATQGGRVQADATVFAGSSAGAATGQQYYIDNGGHIVTGGGGAGYFPGTGSTGGTTAGGGFYS